MKKYIIISLIFHVIIFGGFMVFKYINLEPANNVEKNKSMTTIEQKDNKKTSYINEERESIMNAISITEDELNKEIAKIERKKEQENSDINQKMQILEHNIEIQKKSLYKQKENQELEIARQKEIIEKEKKELSILHNKIKEEANLLSNKQRDILQLKKEIDIKVDNNENLNNSLLINNKKIEEKEAQLQQQSDIISKMEAKIAELQTVLSKEKYEKNEILEKKNKEEIEKLKQETIEYNSIIKDKIAKNWNYKSSLTGISCNIQITQSYTGDILSVSTTDCTEDEDFKESIIEATWKASPLPLPKKRSLFSRNINLFFTIK